MHDVPDLVASALGFVERREPAADQDRLREHEHPLGMTECL
jgi:hypothetical protein